MCNKHLDVLVNFSSVLFFQLHSIAIPPTTFFLLFSKNHFSPTLQFIFFSLGAASVMIARFHSIPFRPKKRTAKHQKLKFIAESFRSSCALHREIKVNSISWLRHVSSRGAVKSATVYLFFYLLSLLLPLNEFIQHLKFNYNIFVGVCCSVSLCFCYKLFFCYKSLSSAINQARERRWIIQVETFLCNLQ